MGGALQRAWMHRGPLAVALWPLSRVYALLAAAHRAAFRLGLMRPFRPCVPVVVVGNVVAGGAGKTPVTIAIVDHLRSRGIAAGVVSRGYGRSATPPGDCLEVHPGAPPAQVGDEPLLIREHTGAPVFVAARRADAVRALLQAHPATRVIVCDDGLQHHALARDIEICVFDRRGTGNGWLLPAGPLREAWPRACDLVLRDAAARGIDGHPVRRSLAAAGHDRSGRQVPLDSLRGARLVAVAGIAQPDAFFTMLRDRGLALAHTVPLPDHHDFATAPELDPGATVLCTEKDAAKLWAHRPDALAVPLEVQIDPAFWPAFDALLERKLSFRHGSQTD